jgi:hypothetical protein
MKRHSAVSDSSTAAMSSGMTSQHFSLGSATGLFAFSLTTDVSRVVALPSPRLLDLISFFLLAQVAFTASAGCFARMGITKSAAKAGLNPSSGTVADTVLVMQERLKDRLCRSFEQRLSDSSSALARKAARLGARALGHHWPSGCQVRTCPLIRFRGGPNRAAYPAGRGPKRGCQVAGEDAKMAGQLRTSR